MDLFYCWNYVITFLNKISVHNKLYHFGESLPLGLLLERVKHPNRLDRNSFIPLKNSSLFDEFLCKLGFFGTSGPVSNASETSVLKAHECQKSPIDTRTR
jgi:hypothetical protein